MGASVGELCSVYEYHLFRRFNPVNGLVSVLVAEAPTNFRRVPVIVVERMQCGDGLGFNDKTLKVLLGTELAYIREWALER